MGSGGLRENSKLNGKDYILEHYISEGAWGKVYVAINKNNQKKVALKFFGYTANQPQLKDIQRELEVMLQVNGISGVVQTYGHFIDTIDGMIPDKTFKEKFPVIVMEYLEGGHMLSRVNSQKNVSEYYIALAFKRLMIALDSLHRKQFLHRDVKLENIMFLDTTDYSPVKIIDLGMMVHCPTPGKNSNKEVNYNFMFQDKKCRGTPGYLAPESITSYQYSPKSDIWQAGCVLYSLLSGMPAFNPNIPEQTTEMTYFPMRGPAWDNVSDLGKDLVAKILKKDPKRRLSSEEILNHPWVLGHAPDTNLGEDYLARIKQLVLRQRLKAFFVDNKIEKNSKERRQHLEQVLPFLTNYSGSRKNIGRRSSDSNIGTQSSSTLQSSNIQENRQTLSCEHIESPLQGDKNLDFNTTTNLSDNNNNSNNNNNNLNNLTPEKEFRDKLRTLKIEVIRSVSVVDREQARLVMNSSPSSPGGIENDGEQKTPDLLQQKTNQYNQLSFPITDTTSSNNLNLSSHPARSPNVKMRYINYNIFVSILQRCDLPELANRQVFNIFDWKNTETIDLKEFLLTMLALQSNIGNDNIDENEKENNSNSYDSKSDNEFSYESLIKDLNPLKNRSNISKKDINKEAKLYFKLFDVYERGYLLIDDLKFGIECILSDNNDIDIEGYSSRGSDLNKERNDEKEDSNFNIETLFEAMDTKKNGRIEFKDFKVFYQNLLIQTVDNTKGAKKIRSKSRSIDRSNEPLEHLNQNKIS